MLKKVLLLDMENMPVGMMIGWQRGHCGQLLILFFIGPTQSPA